MLDLRRGSWRRSGFGDRRSGRAGASATGSATGAANAGARRTVDDRSNLGRLEPAAAGGDGDLVATLVFSARRTGWPGSAAAGRDADERGNLVVGMRRLGERHPLLDAGIDQIGRKVLRSDRARRRPVADERMRQREVLANAGVGALGTGCGVEHLHRFAGTAGQRERQAVVGGVDMALRRPGGCAMRFVVLALGDLDERPLEDDLRLVPVRATERRRKRLPPKRSGRPPK